MTRDPRYDVLFEPVRLGPVTARNRFYQTPHGNGMGRSYPSAMAGMRSTKAEGGWAVVFTEQTDFHYSSDSPRCLKLWDDNDLPLFRRMVDGVHAHGSLAGILLAHNGYITPNLISREAPLSPSPRPVFGNHPTITRAMDKDDIRQFRSWHRAAVVRAKEAGYDIVLIYAAHDLGLPMHFISRRQNERTDEYGGSLENRVRLLRELIEETKEAVGDKCAVGIRFSVDELMGPQGICAEDEGRDVVAMLADMPDYWDVNVSRWANDSASARFQEEGFQEPYVSVVKQVTSKPVVGVGRFTSPDLMIKQIKSGVLDMIGAARPSIADPFLPKKIEEGQIEDIRECIGCNICISHHMLMAPMRCTQNPTMGEEWRRGWHPEVIPVKHDDETILVVGAGPAGLEAARGLGQRGYRVLLAEASTELGGRSLKESRLPTLSSYARVKDYRIGQIEKMLNVEVFLDSQMEIGHIKELAPDRVAVAVGAEWRRDGIGRHFRQAIPGSNKSSVLTPDDIMDGAAVTGPVVIYDDDHYYMATVLAEKFRNDGLDVTIVTPAASVAGFTQYTLELASVQKRMFTLGVTVLGQSEISEITDNHVKVRSIYGGGTVDTPAETTVVVATQKPRMTLYDALIAERDALRSLGVKEITRIGDCFSPGTLASAVYTGHRFARNLTMQLVDEPPFQQEWMRLANRVLGDEKSAE